MADCILGIDCGLTGALAFFFPSAPDRIAVEDMPLAGGEVDFAALARAIDRMRPARAYIELVHAMPKNGSIAGFKLGMAYATARSATLAASVPTVLVHPREWKRHFRLSGGEAGKEAGRALAIRRFPVNSERFERKKDHNRAEAALLALYGAETVRSLDTPSSISAPVQPTIA